MFGKVVDMVEDRQDAFFIGDLTSVNDTISQATTQAQIQLTPTMLVLIILGLRQSILILTN